MMTPEQRQAVAERLEQIRLANGGTLRPSDVVEDAKKKDSPLHEHFEWDVEKAAYRYWIERAREIITSVQVVIKTQHTRVRAVYYVRDPNAASGEQGYIATPEVRKDSDLARDVLVQEFGRIADLLRRARELAKALDAENEVQSLLDNVLQLRTRFRDGDAAAPMQ